MKLFTKNNLRGSVLLSFFVSIILFSAIFSITYAETGVPSILSYQGRLTDSSGNLLGGAGTPYFFKFSFWDSDTVASGTQLWPLAGPSAVSLTVKQGVFNVNIGDTENGYPDILNYNFGSNKKIYLQVEASANNSSFETLSPRQRVTSAPFAEVAGSLTPDYVTTLLNSFVETDPIWNIASTSLSTANFATSSISQWLNDSGYLTAFTESDPLFMAASSSLPYQSPGSYLTSFTELDPIWSASSWSTTTNNSTNWNTAFSWGNHAGLYDLLGSATTTASSTLANWLALNPTSGTNTGDNAPNSQYSGLAGSKQDALNGTGFVKVNGTSITYDNNTYLTAETDPLFTNWDKHAGISITESQISDLQSYLTAESDTLATITARGASTSVESTFSGGLVTSKIRPATDSTSAFQINKADGVTNIFNVDTTNGRVGIGTTSPTSPLMFGSYGTVTNPTIALPNGSTGWYGKSGFTDFGFSINRNTAFSVWAGGAFIPSTSYFGWASTATGDLIGATTDTRIYRTGVGVISIGTTSNNNAGGLRAANVALGGATIGSNALAVTGSAIISGNVGIGTSSPLAKLDITGTAGADDIFAISSSTNTRLFTVAASGNVGIGTITPNSKLSIKGATTREIRFNPDQGVTGDVPTGVSFGGFQSSFSWLGDLAGTAGSKQVIAAYNGTTNGWRSMVETENVAAGSEPNLLLVKTAGNVGIGTTSPTAVLHLKAGTATVNTAPLKFTSGVDLTTPEAGAVEWDGTRLHITQTTGPTRQDIAYLTDITAAAHPAVTLGTANGLSLSTQTLSLGLASSGVTGALSGTDWNTFNSKESVLTFSSGLTRTLNDVHNDLITGIAGGQTAIGGTGVTDILKLQGTTGNGAATFPAIQALVGNNGGTTALTILNNGKVGVGTANPGYGLDIQSSNGIKISTSNFTSGGGRPGIRQEIYDTPGGFAFSMFDLYAGNFTGAALAHLGQIGTYGQTNSGTNISTTGYMFMGSEPTVAYNNNTFRLYPNKNAYFDGNVGIGTSSPLAKLDITGTAGAADIFAISSSTNTRLFTVAASGKVGIGTITPTNMLEVGSVTNGGNVAINGTESAELLGPLSAVGWSLGTGWADNGNGTLTHTGVTSGTITALAPLANVVAGRVYKTVITMTNAKTIYMFLGGYYSYNFTGNTGTFTFYTIATNTGAPNITAQGANSVTITSISIKEVTNGDLLVYGKARFANAIYNAFGNKVIDINSAGKIGLAGADASNSGYSLVVSGSILASGTNMGMYASFFGAHPNFLRYGTTGIIDHDPGPGNTANLRINTLYGATNYERFSITGVVGNGLNLTAESGGTGAANLNITVSPKGTGYTILNGNVGIGTTTPSAILTIQGTSSSPTTNLLNIASSSGSSIFTVLANGDTYMSNYVGIGVVNTHTAGNLQVAGSGYFSGYFQAGTGMYTGSSNANGAGFKPNGNGLKIVNYSGADSTTTSLTLLGNMGIGTSTPVAKLDITGTAGSADIFAISSSTNTRLFTVAANGNVGIGTTTPGQALTVVGNAQFTAVSSGAYSTDLNLTADGTLTTSASDISLKMNLEALNATSSTSSISILDKVIGLKPYRFNWISDPTGAKDIGLIAQDVEGIFPEITFTNRTDGYKGINYSRLSVILVSAIQELNNKVVQLGSYVVDGVANFASVIATKFTGQEADIKNINTEQICIGETCIDETMLKEIILKNSITDTTSDITEPVAPPTSTSTASTTEPVASSTDPVATSTEPIATSTEPVIEEPAATSTEEVIPVATSTEPII